MNNKRREAIASIETRLNDLRLETEDLLQEEQEAFDNLPESLQDSEKGEAMQDAINSLENAISLIEEAEQELESSRE